MKIVLKNVGKRFNRDWIFRKLNFEFNSSDAYVILGANGSGKSTLLQVIGGNALSSEGAIDYFDGGGKAIPVENLYKQLSFASPYLDLLEELTLLESIEFHQKFKPFYPGLDPLKIVALTGLEKVEGQTTEVFFFRHETTCSIGPGRIK